MTAETYYVPGHPWFWTKVYDLGFYRRAVKVCAKAARKAVRAVLADTMRRMRDKRAEPLIVMYECEARLEALIDQHPEAAPVAYRAGEVAQAMLEQMLDWGVQFTTSEDGTYEIVWPPAAPPEAA